MDANRMGGFVCIDSWSHQLIMIFASVSQFYVYNMCFNCESTSVGFQQEAGPRLCENFVDLRFQLYTTPQLARSRVISNLCKASEYCGENNCNSKSGGGPRWQRATIKRWRLAAHLWIQNSSQLPSAALLAPARPRLTYSQFSIPMSMLKSSLQLQIFWELSHWTSTEGHSVSMNVWHFYYTDSF